MLIVYVHNEYLWFTFVNHSLNNLLCQFGLSLRDSIEQWNKGTTRWLRMVVYERTSHLSTVLTYALSALWHGFYPGYYLTFMSGALFTFASRSVSYL
jgi:lysophospholipid acyltransferase 1/2